MKNDYLSSTIFVPLIQQTDSSKSNQSTKSDSYGNSNILNVSSTVQIENLTFVENFFRIL